MRNTARALDALGHGLSGPGWMLIVALLVLSGAGAWARSAYKTLPISQVRPGMKGFGLSVFHGTRPERFDVEVIDVLHQFRPGQDLILIRTPHPLLNDAKSVAGMSGSPIYLEGKLAGAYAYGWAYSQEPIVGVTPIENMLAELRRPIDPEIWRMLGPLPQEHRQGPATPQALPARPRAPSPQDGLPAYRGRTPHGALWAVRQLAARHKPGPQNAGYAHTPIMLSGMTSEVASLLSHELSPFGFLAVQAGAGSGTRPGRSAAAGNYQNGSAIGVQLIRGDISATAVGTVTHVDGQRLLAFGHPMMNMGQTAMPTATAEVVHILSSQKKSFKMSRPLTARGTLVQDRQAAVVVDTSYAPKTIPVALRLRGNAIERPGEKQPTPQTTWNMEVVSNRNLTPILVYSSLISALQAAAADRVDVVFRARGQVRIEGHGRLSFTDEGHLLGGMASSAALAQLRVFSAIDAAYGNPFERANITDLALDVQLEYTDAVAEIVAVRVPFVEVDPGSSVPVHIMLHEYDGTERVQTVQIEVPDSAAGEQIEIEAAAGSLVHPEVPVPANLQDLLVGLQHRYPATSLVVSTKLPSRGLRLRGHVAPRLPESVLNALQTESMDAPLSVFADHLRSEVALGQIVHGSASVRLQVREEPHL